MEAIEWFDTYYGSEEAETVVGSIEILQSAGETVFVPAGWLHIVVNVTETLSITHNYASPYGGENGIRAIWREIVMDEPIFARRWYKELCRLEKLVGGDERGDERGDKRGDKRERAPSWVKECNVCECVRKEHAMLLKNQKVSWLL